MNEPNYFVGAAADHGVTRMRLVGNNPDRLGNRKRCVQERHLGARHHDFAQFPFPSCKNIVDHFAFLNAKVFVGCDKISQLLTAHLFLGSLGVNSEKSNHHIRGGAQCCDERPGYFGGELNWSGHEKGDLFDPLQSNPLGDQLTKHQ